MIIVPIQRWSWLVVTVPASKVLIRIRQLEGGVGPSSAAINKGGILTSKKTGTYNPEAAKAASKTTSYNDASDMVMDTSGNKDDSEDTPKKDKKEKKEK